MIYIMKNRVLVPIMGKVGYKSVSFKTGVVVPVVETETIIGWLDCDGSEFDRDIYPSLYEFLGTNVLPDYRECALVGVGENSSYSIATHDVYLPNEFKDDQMQDHYHQSYASDGNQSKRSIAYSGSLRGMAYTTQNSGSYGSAVTRPNSYGVRFIIKT